MVDRFWHLVAEHGLPYQRKDHVAAVLARGRIGSRAEYEALKDNLVLLEQLGKLSSTDVEKLSRAIEKYEAR
ncbi:hypothetical protein GCM10027569_09340 [Flindersiella endophytica]